MGPSEMQSVRRRLDVRDAESDDLDEVDDDVDDPDDDRPTGRVRLDPGRRGTRALIGVGIVTVLLAVVFVWRDHPAAQPVPPLPIPVTASTSPASDADLVVSVVGAVARPGLVTVPPGSRVADVVAAGGGALPGIDLLSLNLAQRVSDGDQIVVGALAPPVTSSGGAGATESGTISLNDATEAELDALPGVGPVTAASIVAWRTENGPFTSVDQLGEVDGIGPARLEKLRDQVTP